MKFIIAARAYNHKSNGCVALHRLADMLNRTGHTAHVLFFEGHGSETQWYYSTNQELYCPEFKYIHLNASNLDAKALISDAIVVYPEIISGNPLNSGRVVRYYLNGEGIIKKGVMVNPSPHDFVLSWSEIYHERPHFILDYELGDPVDHEQAGLVSRVLDCTYIGKGEKYLKCHVIPGTTEITRTHPAEKLDYINLVRRTRFIYLWDSVSAVFGDAVLYGALPVMMTYLPFGRERCTYLSIEGIDLPQPSPVLSLDRLDSQYQQYRKKYLSQRVRSLDDYENKVKTFAGLVDRHFFA